MLELCQSDPRVPAHLPGQGPSSPIAQFGRAARSRKTLGGSKFLPFMNDGGHFGTCKAAEIFPYPSPEL